MTAVPEYSSEDRAKSEKARPVSRLPAPGGVLQWRSVKKLYNGKEWRSSIVGGPVMKPGGANCPVTADDIHARWLICAASRFGGSSWVAVGSRTLSSYSTQRTTWSAFSRKCVANVIVDDISKS